jgi:hypothetical protein
MKITEEIRAKYGEGASEARHDLHREFEAEIYALGSDVENQVAGRRNRVARSAANLAEGMQLRGTR